MNFTRTTAEQPQLSSNMNLTVINLDSEDDTFIIDTLQLSQACTTQQHSNLDTLQLSQACNIQQHSNSDTLQLSQAFTTQQPKHSPQNSKSYTSNQHPIQHQTPIHHQSPKQNLCSTPNSNFSPLSQLSNNMSSLLNSPPTSYSSLNKARQIAEDIYIIEMQDDGHCCLLCPVCHHYLCTPHHKVQGNHKCPIFGDKPFVCTSIDICPTKWR